MHCSRPKRAHEGQNSTKHSTGRASRGKKNVIGGKLESDRGSLEQRKKIAQANSRSDREIGGHLAPLDKRVTAIRV